MSDFFPQSAPSLCGEEIASFDRIDRILLDLGFEMGAAEMRYPALISRQALEQAEYPKAFPHLLMLATNLRQPALDGPEQLEPANLLTPEWCLSPAVCYHVYANLAKQQVGTPLVISARGQCFRSEASIDPGRRQIEFTIREIVLVGAGEWVQSTATQCKIRLEEAANRAGIFGDWRIAEDPFFLPSASGKALMQRLKETKLEYCVDCEEPLAVASVNRHGDFFGRRFEIRDAGGQFVHSACIAAGLDRWVTCAQQKSKEHSLCHR